MRLCASDRYRLLALDCAAFRPVARPVSPMRYGHRRWAYLVITTLRSACTRSARSFSASAVRDYIILLYILVDRDITVSNLIFYS